MATDDPRDRASRRVDDGGPAFPITGHPTPEDGRLYAHGLSARDWFAGQALSGIFAFSSIHAPVEDAAKVAYAAADAMLAERTKSEG